MLKAHYKYKEKRMSSALTNRQVQVFRCQVDPMVGQKSRLAHVCEPAQGIEHAELTPVGIYLKTTLGHEHLIPFANVQSIRLSPAIAQAEITRLKPGPKPKAL
jgi:hypothetical protein